MKYFECVNCERRGDCPRVSCQMERLANGEAPRAGADDGEVRYV